MFTVNPFDLLVNDEYDDPSQLIIAAEKLKQAAPTAKLPTKPLPHFQAGEIESF